MYETPQSSEPSFYAIIPATIRYCKELEPAAKLLYGEITALTNKYGYCWASNRYFSDVYQVDITTIERWIKKLRDLGFIKCEVLMNGTQRQRKITVPDMFQVNNTNPQNCGYVPEILRGRPLKNAGYINTYNNTEEKTAASPTPSKKLAAASSVHAEIKKSKLTSEQQKQAISFYESNKKLVDSKKNPVGWLIKAIEERWGSAYTGRTELIEKRRQWARNNAYSTGCGYMEAGKEGVLRVSGSKEVVIRYDANDPFWDHAGLGIE